MWRLAERAEGLVVQHIPPIFLSDLDSLSTSIPHRIRILDGELSSKIALHEC
jgi:hypothetical protein